MAVEERARHELYERLEQVIGVGAADTLMAHLPPSGWGDVMTRRDADVLEARLKAELADLRADMADRFRSQTIMLLSAMVGTVAVFNALAVAVLRFT
jgi:hypothetical protein